MRGGRSGIRRSSVYVMSRRKSKREVLGVECLCEGSLVFCVLRDVVKSLLDPSRCKVCASMCFKLSVCLASG